MKRALIFTLSLFLAAGIVTANSEALYSLTGRLVNVVNSPTGTKLCVLRGVADTDAQEAPGAVMGGTFVVIDCREGDFIAGTDALRGDGYRYVSTGDQGPVFWLATRMDAARSQQ